MLKARWWSLLNDPEHPQLSIPAVDGHAEIGSIDTGSVKIEGLTLQAGDSLPAAASSAANAAKPAGTKKP